MNAQTFLNILSIREGSLKMDYDFLLHNVEDWKRSSDYQAISKSFEYYSDQQDILKDGHGRMELGYGGNLQPVKSSAIDKRIMDNQYALAVDKKKNYLFGKDVRLVSENRAYQEKITEIFDKDMMALINDTATSTILASEAYWYPYLDEQGNLRFEKWDPRQVYVFYKDQGKKQPDSFVRFYQTVYFNGKKEETVDHLDFYTPRGITQWRNGELIEELRPYVTINGAPSDYWEGRLPLIIWRLNPSKRIPFKGIKGAQDALNELKSQIVNNALEDERTTLLWIENYSGNAENETFDETQTRLRKKINDRGIIFTETIDGVGGGVRTIQINFDPEKRILVANMLKQTIVENLRSFDAKVFRDSGNPNMLNIKSAYSDMMEDASEMEKEFQVGLDQVIYFINRHYHLDGDVDFLFDKTMMINEGEQIDNINRSAELLSLKTRLAKHPWVDDVDQELAYLEQERKEEDEKMNPYQSTFPGSQQQKENPEKSPERK